MRKTAWKEPTKRAFVPNIRSGWHERIWRGPRGRPRKPIASEAAMKPTWILLATTLLFLSGCNRNTEPEGTIFLSGRIDGDTVDISSKIQGRLVDLAVREGDSVKADQVVAWLSSPQEEAIRDAQKARIISDRRL